jgi:signal transduction histidine kinase/FixJ family two-component response regulator
MKLIASAVAVPLLILLLTWLAVRAVNPNVDLFDQALVQLDRFEMAENALYRDVFTARAGILRNYDPLVLHVNELYGSLDRLRETAAIDAETTAAFGQLAASVRQQEDLVEQFKTVNALLQNSLSLFGRFSVRLARAQQNGPLGPAVSGAAAAMLRLTLDTSLATAREVQERLDELAGVPVPAADADSVRALLAHGRMLHDVLPVTDSVLRALSAVPRVRDQTALRTMVLAGQTASRATARQYRGLLYATSMVLVGLLVCLVLRLRAGARALRRRAGLEHVIAGISVRFINVRAETIGSEIERALADMAEYIGSDRAYCVLSGPSPRSYVWCKTGLSFPSGWPDQAPALAAQLGAAGDGLIHVPHVNRMPPGAIRDRCLGFGLGGWAYVTNAGADGIGVALGFDAIVRLCRVRGAGELSLLRMALDTVVYAVERHSMEKERARLETRLQQARRMETVGALASGISHNFNNILGGILGHAEMAEERLIADSLPAHNIVAIRRGAEQARDLVHQILAFGSPRDGRRRPVSTEVLIADAASLLHASLPSGKDLAIELAPQAAFVSGEPAQLQQVILNLCNNAAQAMQGAGRIELRTEVHDIQSARGLTHGELQPGPHVRIAVSDAGRGMDATILERIFEPFFTTRSAGNGLGLATVREIVREHDGAIDVWSMPGEGSRFEVWLPCIAAAEPAPADDAAGLPIGHGETVLLIASDRAQLLGEEETLAALGYEPIGFTRSDEALAACRATPGRYDMLVVGHFGSATVALEMAAALHAAAAHLPIVLATSSADEIGADALLAAGIADVVRWPIVAAEIAAALDRCLAVKRVEAKASAVRGRETSSALDPI